MFGLFELTRRLRRQYFPYYEEEEEELAEGEETIEYTDDGYWIFSSMGHR